MPFVTEDLWSYLPHHEQPIIIASWPQADVSYLNEAAEGDMQLLIDLVRGIRNVRDEYQVEPARKITALIAAGSGAKLFGEYDYLFARLCNVATLQLLTSDEAAPPLIG